MRGRSRENEAFRELSRRPYTCALRRKAPHARAESPYFCHKYVPACTARREQLVHATDRSTRATHAAPAPLSGAVGPCVSLSLSLWPHRSAFRRSTESSRATIFAGAPSGATHARAHRTTSLPNRSFSTITTITTVSITIKAIFTALFPAYSHYDLATSKTRFLRCEQLPRWARPRAAAKTFFRTMRCGRHLWCSSARATERWQRSIELQTCAHTIVKTHLCPTGTGSAMSQEKMYPAKSLSLIRLRIV